MRLFKSQYERIDGTIPNVWMYPPIIGRDYLHRKALVAAIRSVSQLVSAGQTILDVGCGWMPYRQLFGQTRYIGVDIAVHGSTPIVLVEEGAPLPVGDGSADCCVCWQVLEHVSDVTQFLSEIHRCLRIDGRLFLTTHGVFRTHAKADYRRWTRSGLERLFAGAGWKTVDVEPVDDSVSALVSFMNSVMAELLGIRGEADSRVMRSVYAGWCVASNVVGMTIGAIGRLAGADLTNDCSTYMVTCVK